MPIIYVCIHVYIYYAVCLFDPMSLKVAADHGQLEHSLRRASDERLIKRNKENFPTLH